MSSRPFPNVSLQINRLSRARIRVVTLTEAESEAAKDASHPAFEDWGQDRVRASLANTRFRGRKADRVCVTDDEGRVLWLVGRGKGDHTASLRRAAAVGMTVLADEVDWELCVPEGGALSAEDATRAAAEGVHLADYRCKRTRGEDKGRRRPGSGSLSVSDLDAGRAGLAAAEAYCSGVVTARDLINAPANELGPEELAAAARDIADRYGWKSTTLTGDELLERGFHLVHAVGRASCKPPTFTWVEIGDPSAEARPALVGKGVVFDSGGLNLKPSGGMLLMRKDMGGAGTVLGILESLGRFGFDGPLLAVIPAAENAVGPDSYRPGDILDSLDGKTVEIGNTDAEGRLLLADGLTFAKQNGATQLLDLATLTGAARVALGPDVPALFGTDEEFSRRLLEHSRVHDEPLWRMPLVQDYDRLLDTPFADVNHISADSRGGAITAALFLKRFVGDTPWAHIDMNGWEDKGRPDVPKGASGAVVRTVVSALRS